MTAFNIPNILRPLISYKTANKANCAPFRFLTASGLCVKEIKAIGYFINSQVYAKTGDILTFSTVELMK